MRTTSEMIEHKRDGGTLSPDEISAFIAGVLNGSIPDYQTTAMLMAIFFQGMTDPELGSLTAAMIESGDRLIIDTDLPKVDKHSTGGVGDKISIPLAPLAACCGLAVPMISGRGLGHGGGTLDKLESIPGFRTALDPSEFADLVSRHGVVMAGQSDTIVPADRALYRLRDTTATVASIPLISASIMSKKLAENLDALVLDVKVGEGAFMRTLEEGRILARTMVEIGKSQGVATQAFLTTMDQPLGRAVGNANEVAESVEVLKGGGPPDVVEIVLLLGSAMLELAGIGQGRKLMEDAIRSGAGLEKFIEMTAAQGGDPSVIEDPLKLPAASEKMPVTAPVSGFVTALNAREIGMAALRLGAGRTRAEESLDLGAGIILEAKTGDKVEKGDLLATLYYSPGRSIDQSHQLASAAYTIGKQAPPRQPLLLDSVS